MDLHEDTQTNVVTATFELPGLAKENLQIDADVVNHRLTISGEYNISEDKEDKTKGFTVRERQYGKFARTLPLPHGVEVGWNDVSAGTVDRDTDMVCATGRRGQGCSQGWRADSYVPESHFRAGA